MLHDYANLNTDYWFNQKSVTAVLRSWGKGNCVCALG